MYWSRVKSILIVLFLLVNVFLLVNMMVSINQTVTISPQTIQNTMEFLQKKSIIVQQKDIPRKMQNMPNLGMEKPEKDADQLAAKILGSGYAKQENGKYIQGTKTLVIKGCEFEYTDSDPNENLANLNELTVEANAKKLLEKFRLDLKYIISDNQEKLEDGRYRLTFIQRFSGKDIFNTQLITEITAKGITSIKGYWLIPEKFDDKSMPVRQITGVLVDFANNPDITKNTQITITRISIGYYVDQDYKEEASASPAWRICTSDGRVYYYDAVDGYYLRQ